MSFEFWKRIPTSVALFLFFLSMYCFTMSGWVQYGDEIEKYRVAQSIVEQQGFSFRPTATRNVTGIGGQTYSIYELGQSVFEIPLYVLGRVFYTFFPVPDVNWITLLFVGLLNPILSAATCVVLFKTCLNIGFQFRTSLGLTLVYGLGTIAFPYAKGFTREPLLSFLLLSAFYTVYRFRQTGSNRWLLASGMIAGYLLFTKFIQAIAIPILLVYVLVVVYQDRKQARASPRATTAAMVNGFVLFVLPSILLLGLQGLYALARFGTIYSGIAGTEKNPVEWIFDLLAKSQPGAAIGGLLFSPEKSVFLYSPPVLLGLVAWFKFFRRSAKEAVLLAALIAVAFLSNIVRPDWDGGTWWGPRYLVQITPFLIIPLGFLLDDSRPTAKKFWTWALGLLFAIGCVVQVAAMFRNDRDYLDVTGKGITLLGQLDFLAHGVLDSLVIYLSPTGFPIVLNPHGIVLVLISVVLGGLLIVRIQRGGAAEASQRPGWMVLAAVLCIEFAAFIAGVVALYPQVLAAQGDTRYVAANNFIAADRKCEAAAMYLRALDRGTNFGREAIAKSERLLQHLRGMPIPADDFLSQVEMPDDAIVTKDETVTTSGNGSLKLRLPSGQDASIIAASNSVAVQPSTTYILAGWMKTEAVYGSGTATITVFEDDGNWKQPRTTNVASVDETRGWQSFQGQFTTLATTQRVIVKASLWKTFGTVWVDGLTLGPTSALGTDRVAPACK